jgi:hypothetical protein
MNTMLIVLLLVIGAVMVFSAVKGKDPRDVVKEALKKRK